MKFNNFCRKSKPSTEPWEFNPKQGILTEKDLKVRLSFAKKAKKLFAHDIWCKEICFYLDGAGFTHKFNPCQNSRRRIAKTWRKKSEGLAMHCTTAGNHEGNGGRVAKFMVSIAYGKGVVLCEHFTEKLNGKSFAKFVRDHFPSCFEKCGNVEEKVFLQDGDPSQNSALAMKAIQEVGCKKFSIPPRSPDLNPIENLFHITKRKLKTDAINNEITRETYMEFVERIKETMLQTSTSVIDNVIRSMNKRIDLIIKKKGERTKY